MTPDFDSGCFYVLPLDPNRVVSEALLAVDLLARYWRERRHDNAEDERGASLPRFAFGSFDVRLADAAGGGGGGLVATTHVVATTADSRCPSRARPP